MHTGQLPVACSCLQEPVLQTKLTAPNPTAARKQWTAHTVMPRKDQLSQQLLTSIVTTHKHTHAHMQTYKPTCSCARMATRSVSTFCAASSTARLAAAASCSSRRAPEHCTYQQE